MKRVERAISLVYNDEYIAGSFIRGFNVPLVHSTLRVAAHAVLPSHSHSLPALSIIIPTPYSAFLSRSITAHQPPLFPTCPHLAQTLVGKCFNITNSSSKHIDVHHFFHCTDRSQTHRPLFYKLHLLTHNPQSASYYLPITTIQKCTPPLPLLLCRA